MATVTFSGDVTPCSVIRGCGQYPGTPFRGSSTTTSVTLVHAVCTTRRSMPAPCDCCRTTALLGLPGERLSLRRRCERRRSEVLADEPWHRHRAAHAGRQRSKGDDPVTAHRRLDVGLETRAERSTRAPAALLWEMLMGEQIHVGGAGEPTTLARRAGITASSLVLDVCSALGGPARHLAARLAAPSSASMARRGCTTRLSAHQAAGLEPKATFALGDALDIPYRRRRRSTSSGVRTRGATSPTRRRLVASARAWSSPAASWRSPTGSRRAP